MLDVTAELGFLITVTWLFVRVIRPWLDKITTKTVGAVVTGQEVWLFVLASAFGVTALFGQTQNIPFAFAQVLWASLIVSIGAIGVDNIVQKTETDAA